MQSLQHHHQPSRHRRALPAHEPLCRQPTADARRISRLSCAGDPQRGRRRGDGLDAVGDAAAASNRRAACDQHPQHQLTTLTGLAEARAPLSRPVQQLRGVRAGDEPGDQEERRDLVRAQ